ncbi:hypothetical protein [Myxococcus stipitatus]|uniref:hypothetical protein n=1 Tax=Myxococcus stipitatus TaxID=83455 RepID=UPI0030CCFB62
MAVSKEDPRLHLLAGVAYYLARDNPTLSQATLTTHFNTLSTALNVYPFNAATDGSGPRARTMIRILARAQPELSFATVPGKAFRAYARALLASMRNGLDLERGLASAASMVDRYGEVDSFAEETWGRLYELAQGNVALAGAVNSGGIGAGVGFSTTHTASQILASSPMGPLAGFVLPRLASNGSLSTTPEDARAFVTTASTAGISAAQEYSNMLHALDIAEQAYRASLALAKPAPRLVSNGLGDAPRTLIETPEEKLKAAITEAKTKGSALKSQLNGVREGVAGGLGVIAELFKRGGDTQFAADIVRFSKALSTTLESVAKYAESSIKVAEKAAGILGLGAKGFQIVSAGIFTGQIIGAVFNLISLLRKPAEPPIEQIILQEIRKLHQFVVEMQGRLFSRFDRVDRKLNDIHRDMQSRFALVDWELGRVNQNVEEIQESLHALHAGLNRVDQSMYEYFTDTKNDAFELSAWTYLGWDSRHPVPMRYTEEFIPAESQFSMWGAVEASQSTILAGINDRGSNPNISPADELSTHKLSYNINYLREFPVQLGFSMLHGDRIASPKDWMTGAEAYAQLFEEQPTLGASMLTTRHNALINQGTRLDTALRNIGKPLFGKIHERYLLDWGVLKSLLEQAEVTYKNDPTRGLYGIDMWGVPEQEPTSHALKGGEKSVVPCAGGQWGDHNGDGAADLLYLDPSRYSHADLRPLLIAENLNLDGADIDLCGKGSWVLYSARPTGLGNLYEHHYRLKSTVYVRYSYWDAATSTRKVENVFSHSFVGGHEFVVLLYSQERATYSPNDSFNPDEYMGKKWGTVVNSFQPSSVPLAPAFRAGLRARMVDVLKDQQRLFYGSIAARMEQAGDPLQVQAKRLTGTRLLWQSYVALALPLSLDHDEHLRGMVYGDDALMSGYDTLQDVEVSPVMNDVVDMYALFSAAAAPPAYNLLQDLGPVVTSRADKLKAAVDASLDAQAAAGGPETSAWVEPTLLRLRLSVPN